jgi:DNA-binding LytR/AlgR family response regulator
MFWYTCALASPVAAVYLLSRYIYLNRKVNPALSEHLMNNGEALLNTITIDEVINNRLKIVADYNNYQCEIEQDDFIYAEAVDNYCFIHYYKDGSIQKEIIRISLTKLLTQVQTDAIKRVHRSFIVNLKKVSKYKGNSSGYKIWLENEVHELMISRSYIDSVVPVLKAFVVRP